MFARVNNENAYSKVTEWQLLKRRGKKKRQVHQVGKESLCFLEKQFKV